MDAYPWIAAHEREKTAKRAAEIADAHECGGPDDFICQHQNCGMCISGAILRELGGKDEQESQVQD